MATILVWMSPEASHIVVTLKFATDLVKRGHRAVYLTCGAIRSELEALGFETCQFLGAGKTALSERSILSPKGPSFLYRDLQPIFGTYDRYLDAIRSDIRDAAVAIGAELVLVDGSLDDALHLGYRHFVGSEFKVGRVYAHLPYQQLTEETGDSKYPRPIFLSPREFELPGMIMPSGLYTEAGYFHDLPGGMALDLETESKAVIFCSLGNQVQRFPYARMFFSQVVAAAEVLTNFHFVVHTGHYEVSEWRDLGLGNLTLLPSVRTSDVLPHAAAAIIHGGFGTLKECIYFGVPMLVCPQRWDQPLNARRVEYHQIGLHCPANLISVDKIKAGLDVLTRSAVMKERLHAMRRLFIDREQDQLTAKACELLVEA